MSAQDTIPYKEMRPDGICRVTDNFYTKTVQFLDIDVYKRQVRYYDLFHDVKYPANTTKYPDVSGSYWAVKDISYATNAKWLNGYADGSFKPDTNITRAEVVTVVNRMTGRTADKEYINDNLSVLNKFTDLKNNAHWAYYDIMEAANTVSYTHLGVKVRWPTM